MRGAIKPHPLAALRRAAGLTQHQLARRAHLSLDYISRIETRATNPLHPTRRRLLRALGVEFSEHRRIFG